MSERIVLAFCVHSHQPVGNFPEVFARGVTDCYRPMLEVLRDFPTMRMTLHYTGPLLEWFAEHNPELLEMLGELVDRSQVELLGGAFYEPIIPVIPQDDVREQVHMTTSWLRERFGHTPRGLWCAERIWDPGMPLKLDGLGLQYTLLDDSHFLSAGLEANDVHGSYITEREGSSLRVFPIDMKLRYLIPFREPHETVDYLRTLSARGVRLVTYGDDGEKFGMWPGTRKWVYEERWLRRFFEALSAHAEEITLVPMAEAMDGFPSRGLVYLPTATYQEMMEWSLFPGPGRFYEDLVKGAKESGEWPQLRAFLRGGMWDNFLAKYPESNRMHKKMLQVSTLVREHGRDPQALRHLLMAQCNCPYWHGLFGGIYISGIRHAVYEHLLRAERIVDECRFGGRHWIVKQEDYDLDGGEEVMVSGREFNCYVTPHVGAAVCLLEHKPTHYNLTNILMRHEEIYHREINDAPAPQEASAGDQPLSIHDMSHGDTTWLRDLLVYDIYPRYAFMTHCLRDAPDLDDLLRHNRMEHSLTAELPFVFRDQGECGGILSLGFVAQLDGMKVVKNYVFDPAGTVSVRHEVPRGYWIALEWNLMLLSAQRPFVHGRPMENERESFRADAVKFMDDDRGMQAVIQSSMERDILITPIECASQSEQGFEKTFQGWTVYLICAPGEDVPEVTLRMEKLCRS